MMYSFSKPKVLKYGPCTTHYDNVLYSRPIGEVCVSTVRLDCEEQEVEKTPQKQKYITLQGNHRRNSCPQPVDWDNNILITGGKNKNMLVKRTKTDNNHNNNNNNNLKIY